MTNNVRDTELRLAALLTKHDLFNYMDHMSNLQLIVCPDFIAAQFKCKRTKMR